MVKLIMKNFNGMILLEKEFDDESKAITYINSLDRYTRKNTRFQVLRVK